MKSSQFHTRKISNSGVRLSLALPTGEPTDEWILVVGAESDIFRHAERQAKKELANRLLNFFLSQEEKDNIVSEIALKMLAEAVTGWSFDEPLTQDNIVEFLRESPQIQDQVNRAITDRSLFFKNK